MNHHEPAVQVDERIAGRAFVCAVIEGVTGAGIVDEHAQHP